MSEEGYLSSTDVKHYAYCPKIIYFKHVLHLYERQTESMLYGKEVHDETIIAPLIPKYKVEKVLRNLDLKSDNLKFAGKADFVLLTKFKEYIPVEIKWVSEEVKRIKIDHKYQLISISLLIDEVFNTFVKRAIIYYANEKKFYEFNIKESDKKLTKQILNKIWEIIDREINVEVDQPIKKCLNCGFKPFCKPYL